MSLSRAELSSHLRRNTLWIYRSPPSNLSLLLGSLLILHLTEGHLGLAELTLKIRETFEADRILELT